MSNIALSDQLGAMTVVALPLATSFSRRSKSSELRKSRVAKTCSRSGLLIDVSLRIIAEVAAGSPTTMTLVLLPLRSCKAAARAQEMLAHSRSGAGEGPLASVSDRHAATVAKAIPDEPAACKARVVAAGIGNLDPPAGPPTHDLSSPPSKRRRCPSTMCGLRRKDLQGGSERKEAARANDYDLQRSQNVQVYCSLCRIEHFRRGEVKSVEPWTSREPTCSAMRSAFYTGSPRNGHS